MTDRAAADHAGAGERPGPSPDAGPVPGGFADGGRLALAALPEIVRRMHVGLRDHRDEIDDLNVFPVPDGDTGTNMLRTVRAVIDALRDAGPEPDVQRCVVRGALLGARGNSGVILSQVLRALADTLAAPRGRREPDLLAAALERARSLGYEAVADPVEGTMLTAIAVAAGAAAVAAASEAPGPSAPAPGGPADPSDQLVAASAAVLAAVRRAVEATREALEANRSAGVVDAGARGFEVVLEALHAHLSGAPHGDRVMPAPIVARRRAPVGDREGGSSRYPFEVQYVLAVPGDPSRAVPGDPSRAVPGDPSRAVPGDAVGVLRERLEALGDSVVVVASGELCNVHVHTDDAGAAIEEGLRVGRPSRIQITYLDAQVEQRRAARAGGDADQPEVARPAFGTVAVLEGAGLEALAEQSGAVVVRGAAGSLPPVSALLEAVEESSATCVALLPGHRNVLPAARQVAAMSVAEGRTVEVVEAATAVPAVLAALAVADPTDAPTSLRAMRDAAARAVCGEVVAAVRDADTPIGPVRTGQHLVVAAGDTLSAHADPVDALTALAGALGVDGGEVVTLIVGHDVADEERARAATAVRRVAPAGAVEVVDGGQRPARYLLGVE